MNIFVGNLSFDATGDDVKRLFEGFGNVASVAIVMSKEKKIPKSRGFGFVQMPDEQQALAAIDALNGKEFMGRDLNVNPGRKIEAHREIKLKKKMQAKFGAKGGNPALKDERGEAHPSGRPGAYRGGMLKRSYKSRRGLDGKREEAKPWRKPAGEAKPWKRSAGPAKPWKKSSERPQKPRFKGRSKAGGYKP